MIVSLNLSYEFRKEMMRGYAKHKTCLPHVLIKKYRDTTARFF